MPRPIVNETSQYDHKHTCDCDACTERRFRARNPHLYGYTEAREVEAWMRWRPIRNALICTLVIAACIIGIAWAWTGRADAKPPRPVPAPQSLLRARKACPVDKPLKCRAALRRAYAAVEWQRSENLKLARTLVGNVADWSCIHNGIKNGQRVGWGEAAWNATGHYEGGLQMDHTFSTTYGIDMWRKHHAGPHTWTPREQIIVAQRAFIQGRGYSPWPATSHACGLR